MNVVLTISGAKVIGKQGKLSVLRPGARFIFNSTAGCAKYPGVYKKCEGQQRWDRRGVNIEAADGRGLVVSSNMVVREVE